MGLLNNYLCLSKFTSFYRGQNGFAPVALRIKVYGNLDFAQDYPICYLMVAFIDCQADPNYFCDTLAKAAVIPKTIYVPPVNHS